MTNRKVFQREKQTWLFKVAEDVWAVLRGVGSSRGVVPAQPAVPVPSTVQSYSADTSATETIPQNENVRTESCYLICCMADLSSSSQSISLRFPGEAP